jgi:hypothetical protein
MVLWSAGISAHPRIFPKLIDKGVRRPQVRTIQGQRHGRAIQTHEWALRSQRLLWMKA